jgi:hypothetical protein
MRWTKLDLTCIYFFKKILTHHWFKSSSSIWINWIDCVDFLHFLLSKICVRPTAVASSLSPLQCRLSSSRCRHIAAPCYSSFTLNQDELAASTSSYDKASSCRFPSRADTEALNPHHHSRPSFLDRPTLTLHCYKKIILTVTTLPVTQSCLHFAFSLARALSHQSSTCYHSSLSLLSHAHLPST